MADGSIPPASCGIYGIFGPNGRVYIGQSARLQLRLKEHRNFLDRGNHPNKPLRAGWAKHGEEAFVFKVLAVVDEDADLLRLAEQEFIDFHRDRGGVYNTAPVAGTMRGFKHSEETKRAQSERQRGKKLSGEHKEKIGAAHKGKKRRAGTGDKIAAALRGRLLTEEHCANLSAAHIKDLSGQVFGDLTVIEYADSRNQQSRWRCLCSCGKESTVYRTSLTAGQTTSCGCRQYARIGAAARGNTNRRKDITGQKFGALTVEKVFPDGYGRQRKLYAACKCTCGRDKIIRCSVLTSRATEAARSNECVCGENRLTINRPSRAKTASENLYQIGGKLES